MHFYGREAYILSIVQIDVFDNKNICKVLKTTLFV